MMIGVVIVNYATTFNPRKWLRDNRDIAQPFVEALLRGEEIPVPDTLIEFKIETGREWVSLGRLVGPFYSYGMIYIPTGYKPEHGLGGEPVIIKWRHIADGWYYWVAD